MAMIEAIEALKREADALAARVTLSNEAMRHLHYLYQEIWCEAADSTGHEDFAMKLLPHIQALNRELKFKR